MHIDKNNGNNKWVEVIKLEIDQQRDNDTCKDVGKNSPPKGFENIRACFFFDTKNDDRHETRFVADGHLTDVPLSSICSGVVSLRVIIKVIFLAELNGLDSWGTGIGNSCLEGFSNEKYAQ